MGSERTPETVNGPLLELLKRDVCGGRRRVEIQTVRVVGGLVCRIGELLLAVVEDIAPLGIDAVEILTDHGGGRLCQRTAGSSMHNLDSGYHGHDGG